MASYINKEISEWNTTDLCNWLLANKFRGISELCQKYSINGYDLFYINDNILKTEFNLKSFHERRVTLKLFTKLTYDHLRLNVINSNGDNVILTLDNNPETQLGEISEYIGNMFNINPKYILFKDSTKQEVLSPTVKIVQLLILYPKIYKTLNVSNMKDYHQAEEELMESGNGDAQEKNNINDNLNNNNNNYKNRGSDINYGYVGSGMGLSGDMDFKDMNMNKKYNNNSYKLKNNNKFYRTRENNEINNSSKRHYSQNIMNYKSSNNSLKVNKNVNNNQNNNNMNRNNNNDDNFLLKSGVDDNNIIEPMNNNMNKINLNNKNEDYTNNQINNNLGREYKNEGRNYRERGENERERQNYQFQSGSNEIMDFNDGNNLGLLSSNDDDMKFKPSYQINND